MEDDNRIEEILSLCRLNEQDVVANPHRLLIGAEGDFDHRFGGPANMAGLIHPSEPSLHIIFDLDLSDPRLDFIGLSGVNRLPLVFPIKDNGGTLGYTVTQEGIEVQLRNSLPNDGNADEEDWMQSVLEYFEQRPVDLAPISYDDHKSLVFATKYSSNLVFPELLSEQDRCLAAESHYPFSQIGGIHYGPSDFHYQDCWNPNCPVHDIDIPTSGHKTLIASVGNHAHDGILFWGDEDVERYVRMYFYMCGFCSSIYTQAIVEG